MKKNIGIFIFDDMEVLDFAGPFEVFSVTSQINNDALFNVFTVAKNNTVIKAVNGLQVIPDYSFPTHPVIDVLIISGGQGTRKLLTDSETLNWLKQVHLFAEYTLSICSGARLLGKLGLLNNKPFCTHHEVYNHMKEIAPRAIPQKEKRFVQSGKKLFTSGGISAGIDLSFHVVEMLTGKETAEKTAKYMEYRLQPQYEEVS